MRLPAVLGRLTYRLTLPLVRRLVNGSHRARVVLVCDQEVLLVRAWLSSQRWALPGGGVRRSEDSTAAAARELQEELALSIPQANLTVMGTYEHDDKASGLHWHNTLVVGCLRPRPHLKPRWAELIDAAWFPISQLPANLEPGVRAVLSTTTTWKNLA
jgi:8-oxo-dGTP pyrophosphatase MutT (NUDIX family)